MCKLKCHILSSTVKLIFVRDFCVHHDYLKKELDLPFPWNKLRKYWYRCLHEWSNSDRAWRYPKHVCARVNGTGERMAKHTAGGSSLSKEQATDKVDIVALCLPPVVTHLVTSYSYRHSRILSSKCCNARYLDLA